jgi:hypothetical protein
MRKILRSTLLMSLFLACASGAYADTFDFKAMADGPYGESAWNPLVLNGTGYTLTITAIQGVSPAFAYLDANSAGLGVCGSLVDDTKKNKQFPFSGNNLCNPSDDDNVTDHETLVLVFDHDVTISTLKFNNNHDGDQSLLGDTINIGGSPFTFAVGGPLQDSSTTSPYTVAANTQFLISYYDSGATAHGDEFYLSALTASAVPEPAGIALLGIALLGIVTAGKRFKPAFRSNR